MSASAQMGWLDRPAAMVPQAAAPAPLRAVRVPHPFQETAIGNIRATFVGGDRSTLLVQPTGTGKTFTAVTYCHRHEPGNILWTAHREELIDQAKRDLESILGEMVGVEKAERYAHGHDRVVVASVQTLKGVRLEEFAAKFRPALIVCDEAHHAVSPSYRAIFDACADAKILGLTATPDRSDERAMGQVFDSVAFVYDIADAISEGRLCPIRVQRVLVDAIDLRGVKTVAGDLNQGELDAVMSAEEVLHGVVKPTIELAGNRRTICFTTSVDNAHRMAEIFNRYAPNSARAVDGGTETDERRRILSDHKAGAYQFLCNVGVLTEGYDDPAVSCVAMARPTKSRSLYAQCAGRGLRVFPGKADCLLLDFAGNSGQHSLASALDILGGKYDDEVVSRAREIVERDGGALAQDALEQAARELAEAKAREAARRMRVKGSVRYQTQTVDPFGVLHLKQLPDDYSGRFGMTATEKQIAALKNAGVDVPSDMSRARASQLMASIVSRRTHGLATFKQLKMLQRAGITNVNISFDRASNIIGAIIANGFRPLPPARLAELMAREAGE